MDKQKYQDRLTVLKEKLSFIDKRLAEQDERDRRINVLFEMGRIKTMEELTEKTKEVSEERKAIHQEEASYLREQQHIEQLLVDVITKYEAIDQKTTDCQVNRVYELKERIASITDDKERFDIIHRHIDRVSIENRSIKYEFNLVGEKQTRTRFIEVKLFNGNTRYFHYIPYSGGKNTVLEADQEGNPICEFYYEYLPRFYDECKKKRHTAEKIHRKKILAEKYPADKYIISFKSLKDFLGVERKMAYKLVNEGFLKGTKVLINKHNVAFDKAKCIKLIKAHAETDKWAKRILENMNSTSKTKDL